MLGHHSASWFLNLFTWLFAVCSLPPPDGKVPKGRDLTGAVDRHAQNLTQFLPRVCSHTVSPVSEQCRCLHMRLDSGDAAGQVVTQVMMTEVTG